MIDLEKQFGEWLEDIDGNVIAVRDVAEGAFWPAVVIAVALIDGGLIKREALLAITDRFLGQMRAQSAPYLRDGQLQPLDDFRKRLMRPGGGST